MSTKHTPGPWISVEISREPKKNPFIAIRTPVIQAFDIARIGAESYCTEIDKANARLIAAAPDLLAALQKIAGLLPYGDNEGETKPDGDDAMRVLNHHIAAARAAITKALGN